MRIKICGITNLEDALLSIKAGADALGFVFYKPSPRYIAPEKTIQIIKQLPPFIERVGLFVNEDAKTINKICKSTNISLAQIHFDAPDEFYNELEISHIKVIRAKNEDDINKYSDEYRLVDAYHEAYGGSGKRLNLDYFKNVDCSKIILAGGLDSNNLHTLKDFGFYGVDVSSGTEISDGKKSPKKVNDFIIEAKKLG